MYTFVVYYSNGRPAFSCQIGEDENGADIYYVFTDNEWLIFVTTRFMQAE